jgi:N-acetylglucosaminyl-diphospho-decaprenol L-rhamnosyltransferase
MPTPDAPVVAVVTVTFRSADDLQEFLDSVPAGSDAPMLTVVADNPSEQSERTVEIAGRTGASVVRLPENVGYGRAVNAAVAELPASVAYILISNPDVRLHPGAVDRLRAALDSDAKLGAVGPKVLNDDGTVYPSARRIPSLRTGVGHALFSRVWPTNPWTRAYRQENEGSDRPRPAGWLSGSCLLVRRSAFEQIGGFDAGYFMYFEDVDLGYRLGRAGWINLYEPGAVVTHVGGTSTGSAAAPMLIAHHRSAERFLTSKYRGPLLAPLRWALHIGLEVRARWAARGHGQRSSNRAR